MSAPAASSSIKAAAASACGLQHARHGGRVAAAATVGRAAPLLRRRAFAGAQLQKAAANGSRCNAFFNFKKKDKDAAPSPYHEFHTPEHRDDYTSEEVREYFSYMGMLAEDGTYDRLDAMLASGKHPCDLILLMAAYENDEGKVEELLEAGADITVTDEDGKSPLDLCSKSEVRELLEAKAAQLAAK